MHRFIVPLTSILLVSSFIFSVVWLSTSPDFEPMITSLTLLAAITGLLIDRWLSEREHRRKLLKALMHEIYMNLAVLREIYTKVQPLGDASPIVLPRFYNTTLSTVIADGVFATERDAKLWKLLNSWMQRSTEANVRFTTTEAITFARPSTVPEFHDLMLKGHVMTMTRKALLDLCAHLLESYPKESGIDNDTILFADPSLPNPGYTPEEKGQRS